ncbi:MAG: hypothetical protein IKT98_02875 [Selenomonadaceae bacterium]|nr:hypothetical protein [Selenomonadaceae bacterium]
MKRFFGLCAAIMLLCAMIFPAKTFAEESEGMAAFREALLSDSDAADRIFRQDILFASPFVQAELEILGMADGDTFKSTGEFSLWIYTDDGSVTEQVIPYYMIQNGKNMDIYFKSDKKWSKFTTPSLAAVVTDFITTPTPEEVEEIIAGTKEVTILQENDYRRIMLVHVDGERVANDLKEKANENPADNGAADESELQNMFVDYLDKAFRNADVWYMWTIDKRDWHTVAMQFNLSGIIQELARAALNDPNQVWSDDVSNLLETVAYYSEIRAYTTYPADPAAKKKFELPKDVLKAKPVNDIVQ